MTFFVQREEHNTTYDDPRVTYWPTNHGKTTYYRIPPVPPLIPLNPDWFNTSYYPPKSRSPAPKDKPKPPADPAPQEATQEPPQSFEVDDFVTIPGSAFPSIAWRIAEIEGPSALLENPVTLVTCDWVPFTRLKMIENGYLTYNPNFNPYA